MSLRVNLGGPMPVIEGSRAQLAAVSMAAMRACQHEEAVAVVSGEGVVGFRVVEPDDSPIPRMKRPRAKRTTSATTNQEGR